MTTELELQKLRLDLAWKHFEFHARQRTTMFQYFSTIVPLMIGAYFYFLSNPSIMGAFQKSALFMVAAIGACLSVVFGLLDARNCQLYAISQENIALLEKTFLYKTPIKLVNGGVFRGIITEEQQRHRSCSLRDILVKHKILIGLMHGGAFAAFIVLALYTLTRSQ